MSDLARRPGRARASGAPIPKTEPPLSAISTVLGGTGYSHSIVPGGLEVMS